MESGEGVDGRDPREVLRTAGGRDELNLAEFPVALLATRIPKGLKTLVFEDRVFDRQAGEMVDRKLTITGGDAYGLPTAIDDEVLVALIQLTKLANNFTEPKVTFTRYELLKLLDWHDVGKNYRRLEESLNRWLGVSFYYDRAWWDKTAQCWVDAKFHVLDNVYLFDRQDRRRQKARGRPELAASSFKWNEVIFKSFQAENIKRLDLDTYFALAGAISKRMFRFLDKRFYLRRDWEFDLREFAFEHVGMSRNYDVGEVKSKLQPALEELESIGFLEPMGREERYAKVGRGEWKIVLARKTPLVEAGPQPTEPVAAPDPDPDPDPDPGAEGPGRELIARGVTPAVAAELAEDHPAERIAAKLEVFDWLQAKKDRRVAKNPAGFLVKSIRDDFAAPKGFEAAADRARRLAAEQERTRRQEEARLRGEEEERAREAAERSRADAYWGSLAPDRQEALRAEALSRGNPFFRRQYEQRRRADPPAAEHWLRLLIGDYIAELLGRREGPADGADPAPRVPVI